MNFSEAFNQAFEMESEKSKEKGEKFIVSAATAKTLAFMWNMLSAANFVLDDFVQIDKNNNIVSIPKETSKKVKKKTDEKIESVNGKEKQEK